MTSENSVQLLTVIPSNTVDRPPPSGRDPPNSLENTKLSASFNWRKPRPFPPQPSSPFFHPDNPTYSPAPHTAALGGEESPGVRVFNCGNLKWKNVGGGSSFVKLAVRRHLSVPAVR